MPTEIDSEFGRYVRPAEPRRDAGPVRGASRTPGCVAGSTDWGVELNIRHARAALSIGIDRLERAPQAGDHRRSIDLGGALTLSEIERGLAGQVPLLAELFPQFASRLIRNGATLGGNLGTASPIGDCHTGAAGAAMHA